MSGRAYWAHNAFSISLGQLVKDQPLVFFGFGVGGILLIAFIWWLFDLNLPRF
jgi:surfactin synthase thioesterase subunit